MWTTTSDSISFQLKFTLFSFLTDQDATTTTVYPDDLFTETLPESFRSTTSSTFLKHWKQARKTRNVSIDSIAHSASSSSFLHHLDLSAQHILKDVRLGSLSIEWFNRKEDFEMDSSMTKKSYVNPPPSAAFIQFTSGKTKLNAGILHLYKDTSEIIRLKKSQSITDTLNLDSADDSNDPERIEDQVKGTGTILAFLSVPSYMTPQDFLAFITPSIAANSISHIRIIRDSLPSRYVALVKFKNAEDAAKIKRSYHGIKFNSFTDDVCNVVWINKVEYEEKVIPMYSFGIEWDELIAAMHPSTTSIPSIGPTKNTPMQSVSPMEDNKQQDITTSTTSKSIIELPTCPVCLERLDSSVSGLLTILCQHTFHCSCLVRWSDSSCPVCRYSSKSLSQEASTPFNKCSDCDTTENLWICLICGNIGCGRYNHGHAQRHFSQMNHLYSLEIETQRVWDYAGDNYVHRIIQNKADGKLVEVSGGNGGMSMNVLSNNGQNQPVSSSLRDNNGQTLLGNEQGSQPMSEGYAMGKQSQSYHGHQERYENVNPEKLETITLEYTYLLTSQLETQRILYETQLESLQETMSKELYIRQNELDHLQELMRQTHLEHEEERQKSIEKLQHSMEKQMEKLQKKGHDLEIALQEERSLNQELIRNQDEYKRRIAEMEMRELKKEEKMKEMEEQLRDMMFAFETREKLTLNDELREGTLVIQQSSSSHHAGGSSKSHGNGARRKSKR